MILSLGNLGSIDHYPRQSCICKLTSTPPWPTRPKATESNPSNFCQSQGNFRPSGQQPNRIFKKGYCWEYQRPGKCAKAQCNRTHKCSLCDAYHGGTLCSRGPRPNPTNAGATNTRFEPTTSTPNSS